MLVDIKTLVNRRDTKVDHKGLFILTLISSSFTQELNLILLTNLQISLVFIFFKDILSIKTWIYLTRILLINMENNQSASNDHDEDNCDDGYAI